MNASRFIQAFICTWVTMQVLVGHAASQPNDNELRAAYCLKIYQARVAQASLLNGAGPKFNELRDKAIDAEKRLQGYLMPRLQSLDVDAVLFAANRAEEDLGAYKKTPCFQAIKDKDEPVSQMSKKQMKEFEQCFSLITQSSAAKRISSCDDLSWLPF